MVLDQDRSIQVETEIKLVLKNILKNKTALFGATVIIIVVGMAILAPIVSPYDPYAQNLKDRFAPPSWNNLFGRDDFGRDILSRIIYGAQISLQVGLAVSLIDLIIAVILGAMAGYYGGKIDNLIMRSADIFLAFPGIILSIAIMAVLGQSVVNVIISLAIVNWPAPARVIRAQTLSLRELDFIKAAKVAGANNLRIISRHVIPNTIPPIIVLITLGIGWAILAEAGLSFLGLGIPPPAPSWGAMIAAGSEYIITEPMLIVWPGLVTSITVLAFNMLGDALRDALDPRLKI